MRSVLLRLAALLVLLVPISSAHARSMFGTDEEIHFIQDVTLKGAQQEALYLGYMTRTQNFLLGYSIENAGYVLGVKGQGKRYYAMPKAEDVARFQKAGHLPDPLSPYSLGFFDYLAGYSLWWGLAIVALVGGWGVYRKTNQAPGEQASPADEASPAAASEPSVPSAEAAPASAASTDSPAVSGVSPSATPSPVAPPA